jgi:hypothetical protein
MTEDQSPPDGKAMITESGNVAINGFDISGVTVGDSNGAAVRYQGGNLSLGQDSFHNNQEGILAASDPNGSITINDSEFADNGDGSGYTHNIYVDQIATLTVENSYIHDANVGHDIKSRAQNTVITDNRIQDDQGGTASYEIDVPNAGTTTITGNTIEKGPNAQNPNFIAYGEEGIGSGYSTALNVSDNTFVNDNGSPSVQAVWNATGSTTSFDSNSVWALAANQLPPSATNTDFLSARPTLDDSHLSFMYPPEGGSGSTSPPDSGSGSGSGSPPPNPPPVPPPPPATLPLISQAAWQAEVLADFGTYAQANPAVLSDPTAGSALFTEYFDPLTGSQGIPAAAVWGPFPS